MITHVKLLLYSLQFETAKKAGLIGLLEVAAQTYGISPEVAIALASRETGIRNILGDKNHGIGTVQVDRRYHQEAAKAYADGTWRTRPEILIHVGMRILRDYTQQAAKKFPHFNAEKIGLSAYNAGFHGAELGVANGDSDSHTTGRNYALDVLERAEYFRTLL